MTGELLDLTSYGTGLVIRVNGRYGPGVPQSHDWLAGEMVVTSEFVSGSVEQIFLPQDLDDWEAAIELLAAGVDASWMHESGRTPELHLRFLDVGWPALEVTVDDPNASRARVTLVVDVTEGWIDDLRTRLAQVRRDWPRETEEPSPGVYVWRNR
jgi:hypothetical protein